MLRHRKFLTAGFLGLLSVVAACAERKPGSPIRPGFNMFSKDQDIQLGQQAAKEVLQQYPVVNNQEAQGYIKRIGATLANTPTARGTFPFSFTLLHVEQVNAFALPGGPAFVFTGLVKEADNEAQLAGVLAHEMSHVILRHGTNQASKAQLLQIPAALAGAALGGSATAQLLQLGLGVGLNGLFLKFSRTDESQADAMGTHIMAEAGYNPIEMAHFFEKLEAGDKHAPPQILSDHPNPGNRIKAVEAEIRTLPQRQYADNVTGEFQHEKELVASLGPGAKGPRQTVASQGGGMGGPQTDTGGFQQLQNSRFALAYPAGWQAFNDQNGGSVTLAPRQGLVETNHGISIGYGAVVSYYSSQSKDLSTATQELVKRLQSTNEGMRVRSRARQVNVSGSPGMITQLSSQSPAGGAETDYLLTVARPEGLFYMVFVAPAQQFGQLRSTFEQMIQSIRFAG